MAWHVEHCAMRNEVECGLRNVVRCGMALNVESCAMWNEVVCGLRHGTIRGSGVMRNVISGGM